MAKKFTPWVLSQKGLDNLTPYVYCSEDKSLIANYVMQPFWQSAANYLPLRMAPNLVTLVGFFFVMLSYLVTAFYSPNFTESLPSWVHLLNCICLFLYQTFDALDGKQARRTQSSSALGELFDHGCDAMTSVFSTLTVFGAMRLGSGWPTYLNLLTLMGAFFIAQWEVYFTGKLHLWYINVTEAQIVGMLIHLASFLFGDIWLIPQPAIWGFTLADILVPGSSLFSILSSIASMSNTYMTANKAHRTREATRNLASACFITFFYSLWAVIDPTLLTKYPHLFHTTMGFLFANIITKLTTARVCKVAWEQYDFTLFPLPFFVLNSFLQIVPADTAMYTYGFVSVASYLAFGISVIHDISHSLDIYALRLK